MKTSLIWLMRAGGQQDDPTFYQPNTWNYAPTFAAGGSSTVPATFTQPIQWDYNVTVVPPESDTTKPETVYQPTQWNYNISVIPAASDPAYPVPSYGSQWNFVISSVTPFSWGQIGSFDSYLTVGSAAAAPNNINAYGILAGVLDNTPLTFGTLYGGATPQSIFRPDGQIMIWYNPSAGGVQAYRRTGNSFVAINLGLPAGLGSSPCNQMAWSANGERLAFAGAGAAATGVAHKQVNSNTYTGTTGTTASQSVCISPDGEYVGFGRSSGTTMYKWGGTVTAPSISSLGVPTGNVNAQVRDMAFSPDGNYVAVTNASTSANSGLIVFKRTGDSFASLSITSPASSVGYQGVAWSSDGTLLVATSTASPFMVVLSRVGDTFTQETTPTTFTGMYGVAFTKDGNTVYVMRNATPYLKQYSRSGNTLTLATDPAQPGNAPIATARNFTLWPQAYYGP